jgi:hypothetical protein
MQYEKAFVWSVIGFFVIGLTIWLFPEIFHDDDAFHAWWIRWFWWSSGVWFGIYMGGRK